jgi:hypothetical protein
MEQAEKRNAEARDPSTYVDHKSEEFCKACYGHPDALGRGDFGQPSPLGLSESTTRSPERGRRMSTRSNR